MNQITISSDSDSDASMFASSTTTNRPPNPPQSHSHHHHHHHTTHHPTIPTTTTPNNTSSTTPSASDNKRKSTTHRTHETIHISNTILSSKELLLLHSLAANESVPRTRRRFMAQVVEPDDPLKASNLVWDRAIPTTVSIGGGGGGGGGATAVGGLQIAPGNVVDVVETDDGNGWERLRVRKSTGGSSSPMARKTSSPGGSKRGLQQRVVSGSSSASRSGSPLASPFVRGRGRREDGDGDVDMDIY
jgi:hypothetical protein